MYLQGILGHFRVAELHYLKNEGNGYSLVVIYDCGFDVSLSLSNKAALAKLLMNPDAQ